MNEIFRERFDSLWGRWASVVWHREELHRTLEMIREDQRLRYAQSTFVGDLRVWYADHVGVAIQAERHGTAPSALNRMVRDACTDFATFQSACADPSVFHDGDALEQLWAETVAASESVLAWFSASRLLSDGIPPTVTYDDLDGAVDAFERATLTLQRAITGGGSSSLLATEQ